MKSGEFEDGSKVLRAKIDMAHDNLNLRDPVMYRVRKLHHQRTGDDLVHLPDVRLGTRPESDSIEGITHSLCTLEFEHAPAALRLVLREPRASTTRSRSSSRASTSNTC